MDNFERVSDTVRRRLESLSSTFQTLSERGQFLIRTRSASRSNAFSFLLERVWLLVQMSLASCSNAFGSLFKCVSFEGVRLLVQTYFIYIERIQAVERTRSYAERTRLDEKRVIPCA